MSERPADADDFVFRLQLFVIGSSERSARAIVNVRRLCETHLPGRYELEVIDIVSRPDIARREQLVAAPTLLRQFPLPQRRLIGDMSATQRLLFGLGLGPCPQAAG